MPAWLYGAAVSRLTGKTQNEEQEDEVEAEVDAAQQTPSSDSVGDDFELLDKSTDSLGKAKSSGTQQGARANKRKNKKR